MRQCRDIFVHHILPFIATDWLLVNKEWHAAAVRVVLCDTRVYNAQDYEASVRRSVNKGRASRLAWLLKQPRTILPRNKDLILTAAQRGHLEVVKVLMADDRIDPSDSNSNRVIIYAAMAGHVDVVRQLLTDPRVDPGAQRNGTLRGAIKFANRLHFYGPKQHRPSSWELIELLLGHARVDPSADDQYPIRKIKDIYCARLLLRDPRVDPSARECEALFAAMKVNNADLVRLLLEHPAVDLFLEHNDDAVVDWAAKHGHFDIVRRRKPS
jgi:hypothetical protein